MQPPHSGTSIEKADEILRLSDLLPDRWTVQYIALLIYTFGMVTGRLPVGTAAALLGLFVLMFSNPGFRGARPFYWMVALFVWAAVGYLFANYQEMVSDALFERLKLVLVALLTISAIRTRRQAQFFLMFALLCFLLYPVRGALMNYFVYNYTAFGRAVAGGIYNNSNDLAALTLLQLSVAAGLFATSQKKIIKLLAIAAAASMALTILLTQSRGVFLGGLVFLGIIVYSGKNRLRTLAAVVMLMAAMVMVLPESTFERFTRFTAAIGGESSIRDSDPEGSAEGRSDVYRIALTVAGDHPVLGVGLGTYPVTNLDYAQRMEGISATASRIIDAHSTYLTVLAENGAVGLILFLLFLRSAMQKARNSKRTIAGSLPRTSEMLRFLVAGYLGFLVAAVVGTYTTMSMTYVHLFAIWVLATTALDEHENSSSGSDSDA